MELIVRSDGASADFDCASGTIDEALGLDGAGTFVARGTVTLDHGGPAREGELPDLRSAVYSARLDGGELTLSIQVTDLAADMGPFMLRLGATPFVVKCL